MNLGELHSFIRDNIRRGTSLDSRIPEFVRRAVFWIERNKTYQYMNQFVEIEVNPAAPNPRFITLEDNRIKRVSMFRWNNSGEYSYLRPTIAEQAARLEVGTPWGYWLDGVERIVLNLTPDEILAGELTIAKYTDWPVSLTATNWLLDHASDLLEAQAMMGVGLYLRDPNLTAQWRPIRDEALTTLAIADDEYAFSNADLVMGYSQ